MVLTSVQTSQRVPRSRNWSKQFPESVSKNAVCCAVRIQFTVNSAVYPPRTSCSIEIANISSEKASPGDWREGSDLIYEGTVRYLKDNLFIVRRYRGRLYDQQTKKPVRLKMKILREFLFTATLLMMSKLGEATNVCDSRLEPGAVMCQIAGWQGERYAPVNVNVSLCTHILINFGTLCSNGTVCGGYFTEDPAILGFGALSALKAANRNLYVGMVVGGFGEGWERFEIISADPNLRKALVNDIVRIMRKYEMNILELAWVEIPPQNMETDKQNYVLLVKEVAREMRMRGWLIGVSLKTAGGWFDQAYDLVGLATHVDYLNVQGYDYHGHWEDRTGINAALESDNPDDRANVKYFLERVVNQVGANCVVLAIPMFGRRWVVPEGEVEAGPGSFNTVNSGFHHGYYEICVRDSRRECSSFDLWDNISHTPYGVCGLDYYSYDNAHSIEDKVDLARRLKIKGVSAFTIDYDDYRNLCGNGKYPLLKAAQKMRNPL